MFWWCYCAYNDRAWTIFGSCLEPSLNSSRVSLLSWFCGEKENLFLEVEKNGTKKQWSIIKGEKGNGFLRN